MIPDFKTYIRESVWSDMHKRSTGSQTRKEDNIDLITDRREFVKYLKNHYKELDLEHDGLCNIESGKVVNYVMIPVYVDLKKETGRKYYYLEINEFGDDGSYIMFPYVIFDMFPEIYNDVKKKCDSEKYVIKTHADFHTGKPSKFDMSPKNKGVVKNSFVLELLDILLADCESPLKNMLKKKDINESVWSDMHRRSTGTQVRKEDDINNFSPEAFMDYLNQTYKKIRREYRAIELVGCGDLVFPLERRHDSGFTYTFDIIVCYNLNDGHKIDYIEVFEKFFIEDYPQFLDLISSDYKIDDKKKKITLKKGGLKNSNVLDIIDKALSVVKKPIYSKV